MPTSIWTRSGRNGDDSTDTVATCDAVFRRRLLQSMVLAATLLLLNSATLAAGTPHDRPANIVIILADDAGYGDIACFGGRQIPTPHLDQMAAEGMRLTRHYAGCTVCAPSRCVLMTGLHTGHCTVRGNSPGLLNPDDITLPEILKQAGYVTGCTGKWGIGNPPPLSDPNDHGFDHFFGYVSMWHAHNFYPEFIIRNGREVPLRNVVHDRWQGTDGRGVAKERVDYVPELVTQEALAFIQKHREEPFFLFVSLNIPHANNEAGRDSTFPEKGMEVPDFGPFADEDWPAPEKGFAAMIHNMDRDVGRVLRQLKNLGIDDQTVVLFTSDNGPHQEGGHQMEFFDSNGALRGRKRDLYEGGIRVPFIARAPGRIPAGASSELPCGFQDVLPTIAEIASVPVTHQIDGVSLWPTLTGNPESQQQHDYLYWEFSEQGGKQAVLKDGWKLVKLNSGTANPRFELFQLASDPAETKDVSARHPKLVAALKQLLAASHTPNRQYPLLPEEK
jgi:arylsulfatase A-like enzyme